MSTQTQLKTTESPDQLGLHAGIRLLSKTLGVQRTGILLLLLLVFIWIGFSTQGFSVFLELTL